MRTLKFVVRDLIVSKDPTCDFSGLIPGTEGYIQVEFSFSGIWRDCDKVIAFTSMMGKEYPPQVLKNDICTIPAEALKNRKFNIQVLGKSDEKVLKTNKVTINQNGG